MALKTLDQHIESTPGISGGKPRIAGHRITVQNIVIWHERMGMSADEIATEFDLALADVTRPWRITLTTSPRSTRLSRRARPS